jgi:hypothetical protein
MTYQPSLNAQGGFRSIPTEAAALEKEIDTGGNEKPINIIFW